MTKNILSIAARLLKTSRLSESNHKKNFEKEFY